MVLLLVIKAADLLKPKIEPSGNYDSNETNIEVPMTIYCWWQ